MPLVSVHTTSLALGNSLRDYPVFLADVFFLFFIFYSVPMKQYIPPVHTISTHTNMVLLMHCIMNI